MINKSLYKYGIKKNWKLFAIFSAIITMYFVIIVTMFNPDFKNMLDQFSQFMPKLISAVGMMPINGTMEAFLSAYLYGFIMILFPMLLTIILTNGLVVKHTEKGSAVFLLSAPVKRKAIVITQMLVLITFSIALIIFTTIIGLISSSIFFPGQLHIGKFILLNVGTLGLHLFIAGLCFLASCIFNESRKSLMFGAGISVFMYVLQMVAQTGDKFSFAKYFTFFTMFNPNGIVILSVTSIITMVILFVCAAAFFIASVFVYDKKDFHI